MFIFNSAEEALLGVIIETAKLNGFIGLINGRTISSALELCD